MLRNWTLKFILLTAISASILAQPFGDPTFRKQGTQSGNKVRTVFFNDGLVAGTLGDGPEGEWPIGSGNMYIGDVSPLLGVEATQAWIDTFKFYSAFQDTLVDRNNKQFWRFDLLETIPDPIVVDADTFRYRARVYSTIHSVGTSDGPRGWTDGPTAGGNTWTFQPIPGYANADTNLVAMSTDLDNDGPDGLPSSGDDDGLPDSWPTYWPDKMNSLDDPGWPGAWNGYFGKNVKNADQESFFVMDDNNDIEFNYRVPGNPASEVVFKPDSINSLMFGMGLETSVRGLQWAHFLAEDAIFWLYDVKNRGTTDYKKAAFGMMVGTLAGGRCGDSNDDLAYFDSENDITYSYDAPPAYSPCFDGPVGYAGYAFLESPGNSKDGIDNDGDNHEAGGSAPYFTAASFGTKNYQASDQVVTIDPNTFARSVVTLSSGTNEIVTQGRVVQVIPGETRLREIVGNLLDDDLDGIIDEDTLNHYLNRISRVPPLQPLPAFQYVDYINGLGTTDLMLDEDRGDGIDNDGDWDPITDDVGIDGVAGTGDLGEGDGLPTSGFQPNGPNGEMVDTGLPGEPHVDKTDIDESDQIGLTSFVYFTPPGAVRMSNDTQLWDRLEPSINVNSDIETNPVDGDFIYGAGYFPMQAKQTERFSVGLVFGEDFDDILNNKITIQQIYDNNYNFSRPPDKPMVRVVPGDGQVTLYWEDGAEFSYDPVSGYDFEGYKIYKATDFGFNEANTITDGFGNPVFYEPVAQFDKIDGIEGFFQGDMDRVGGAAFYLGKETGLKHSWTDTNVVNGQRYFYAVVSYDHGDVDKNIYPAECTKTILELNDVLTFDQNTVQVTPNARVPGYQPPIAGSVQHLEGDGDGILELFFLDEYAVKDAARYEMHFLDMSNDMLDNDSDWVAYYDANADGEFDLADGDTIVHDTGTDGLWAQNIGDPVYRKHGNETFFLGNYPGPDADGTEGNGIPDTGEPNLDMKDPDEMQAVTSQYSVLRLNNDDTRDTLVRNSSYFYATNANYTNLRDNYGFRYPDIRPETPVVDGVRYIFGNEWRVDPKPAEFSSNREPENLPSLSMAVDPLFNPKKRKIPHDYEVVFYDSIVQTSSAWSAGFSARLFATPINFRVFDTTTGEELENPGYKAVGGTARDEIIYFITTSSDSERFITWTLKVEYGDTITILPQDTLYTNIEELAGGDTLRLVTRKPFTNRDVFYYETLGAKLNTADASGWQDRVRVVPNPYVAAASWEPTNRFTSGRGERRIDFIHLPADAEVRIYTIRGDHLQTLSQDGSIFDGSVSWNLRTKEGLDVSFGVYLYHIDAGPLGEATGKFAIIK